MCMCVLKSIKFLYLFFYALKIACVRTGSSPFLLGEKWRRMVVAEAG